MYDDGATPTMPERIMSTSPRPILYVTRPAFGLPDASPFVMKTDMQLRMAGVDYERRPAIPPQSPSGKLPYLDDGGEVITDSTFIRAHIERRQGIDLDAALDDRGRAAAWALERLLEDHLYFAMVWYRWIDADNFARGPAHFVDDLPEAERAAARSALQGRRQADLHAQGIGRHRPQRIAELGTRSLTALSQWLGDQPWLMGARPSAVDATAAAMLAAVLTPFFSSPLQRAAATHDNLVAYTRRVLARFAEVAPG